MDPDPDISDPDQKNWNRIWQKGPGSETQHERQCCGAGTCLGRSGSRSSRPGADFGSDHSGSRQKRAVQAAPAP